MYHRKYILEYIGYEQIVNPEGHSGKNNSWLFTPS